MARKKRDGPETVSIPTSSDPPPSEVSAYNIIIYGEKGIGKSTLAAEFPGSLHFLWEPGRYNLRVPCVPDRSRREEPLDWLRFHEYVDLLISGKYPKVRRLNVDSLDMASLACEQYHAGQLDPPRTNLVGVQDHGKAWRTMKDDWDAVFYRLVWADYRLTFTSHCRYGPRLVRSRDRESVADEPHMCQPTCRGWAWEFARVVCDYAWCYTYTGTDRMLIVNGQEDVWASNATMEDHFLDKKTKKPVDALDMGSTPGESYKMLCNGFANKAEGIVFE